MARRRKKKNEPKMNIDATSLILIVLGIVFGVLIYSRDLGPIGAFIKDSFFGGLIGRLTVAVPIILIVLGIYVVFRDFSRLKLKTFQVILLVISVCALMTAIDYPFSVENKPTSLWNGIDALYRLGTEGQGGGVFGAILAAPLIEGFNKPVAFVIIIALIVVTTVFVTGITFSSIIFGIRDGIANLVENARARREARAEEYEEEEDIPVQTRSVAAKAPAKQKQRKNSEKFRQIMEQSDIIEAAEQLNIDLGEDEEEAYEEEPEEEAYEEEIETEEEVEEPQKKQKNMFSKRKKQEEEDNEPEELNLEHNTIEEYEEYEFPPIDLLNASKHSGKDYSVKELKEIAIKLQTTLASFGVEAKVTNVTKGPTVTRYELQPNVGVKVSKILNLSDDIALNLAAKSIRIEAPIPGKSAVGIEVPNKSTETVWLRDIIESDEFQEAKSKISFSLGKGIDGSPAISDIAKMPHLLIAGSTGSGKSVCINSIIMSLLYKANPSEVKLILIDPKVVELGVYNGIPHLLIPVVTDPKKAAGALNWAVQEMVNRYNLFASKGVRDIKGYNELLSRSGEEGVLPQIVIVIDELADLMMVAPNEVEDAICRLAQMARAAGMHLIIATQRPSVDVITGIIKANIPSRIAFTVSSQVDSRTILDMAGAEKLLGKGDMLYYPVGESKPIRVQGSFVTDQEIETVVDYIKENNQERYNADIMESLEKGATPQASGDSEDDCDELLTDAIELAVSMGNASASMIQRKFKVGYARAGRIIDQMEERGIVSGYDGSKPRQTLISKEEWEEMKEQGETEFVEEEE
ncbi:MAG: DNA translocase FtsK 4TM domain-containing protein [Clostridia bacterium]|nr:DNA translocase FtsK 4TM domain-containing protein [Clostridia bacterium]